ncbi:phenylacetate--CoA ligase family protein [Sorangium sp. So ce204]|uniref:phenylacetate--CoA ligase family protein n=1 Tax=Sorangium sp. So ce204 TaxID=3133288 RepID=UPI003F5E52CF
MLDALRFAEQKVPFYRRRFAEHGVRVADVKAPEDLVRFPVLTKADILAHGRELLAEGYTGKLIASATGGSTGESLRFYLDHGTYEHRIAAAMRSDGWAGAKVGEKELHIWGTPILNESLLKKRKRELHEAILRKKYVSAFDLSEQRLAAVVDDIVRYRPNLIIGYTNPLYHTARFALETGRELPAPRGLVCSAERLFDHQRWTIERAFNAPLFNRYGCREVMLLASECDRHEGLHINMEGVYLELVHDGRHATPGEPGEVIVSDLISRSMPLLRYKNEDIAIGSASACSCGRGLPLLASVEGRVLDMIVGPDGRLLAGEFFPHLLKDYPSVKRYQVHQDRSGAITIKIVPAKDYQDEHARLIEQALRKQLGDRAVLRIRVVDDIALTGGGKHRVTISDVPSRLDARRDPPQASTLAASAGSGLEHRAS